MSNHEEQNIQNNAETAAEIKSKPKFKIVKQHFQGAAAMVIIFALAISVLQIMPGKNLFGTMASMGTSMSQTTRYAHFKIANPENAFSMLAHPVQRNKGYVKTPGLVYDPNAGDHIQGYVFYNRGSGKMYHIFSHNNKNQGFIYIAKDKPASKIAMIDLPSGYNHPGGMQIIGDYLFVAAEGSGKSAVFMYDLTPVYMYDDPPGKPVTLISLSEGGAASAVGITDIPCNATGGIRYVLAINNHGSQTVSLYLSNVGVSLSAANSSTFVRVNTNIKFKNESSYDGMALLGAADGSVWLMGFRANYTGSYADFADLYNIGRSFSEGMKLNATEITPKATKQFNTEHGFTTGLYGVHFRWGTGLTIYENDRLRLNVTQREVDAEYIVVNTFFNYK